VLKKKQAIDEGRRRNEKLKQILIWLMKMQSKREENIFERGSSWELENAWKIDERWCSNSK
jgi:hypothetical protein